jgi:HD-GYP domain-containing protein (c-di-GMP phosphodiesterase class II)
VASDSRSRPQSSDDHAAALGVLLREEFGVPFAFYDPDTGRLVAGGDPARFAPVPATLTADLHDSGRANVTALPDGRYRLAFLAYLGQQPALVAVGEVDGLRAADPVREAAVWRGWLQAVCDRLRQADQFAARRQAEDSRAAQAAVAWEALLVADQAARGVRIHRDRTGNQQRILDAAFGLLKAESLWWVPARSDEPVVVRGEPRLSEADGRQLAATLTQVSEWQQPAPFLCNDTPATRWGARFPGVANLMAFAVTDHGPCGVVLALNKHRGQPFRRADAALLTPFVALLELHARGWHRYQDLKDLLVGLTRSLASALDAKDSYTYGHSERVARIAVELGKELGLDGDELGDIYLAGLLHDVGKIGIRDTVLRKPGPLTPEEHEHIKQHVVIGYSILSDLRQIRNLLPGVLYHHERWDGGGYPDGLAGENIPLLARVLAVADAYDAMSNARPYRDPMPCRKVEEVLQQGAGVQWDRRVIEAFGRCRQRIHTIRLRGLGDSLQVAIDGALRSESRPLTAPTPLTTALPDATPAGLT